MFELLIMTMRSQFDTAFYYFIVTDMSLANLSGYIYILSMMKMYIL